MLGGGNFETTLKRTLIRESLQIKTCLFTRGSESIMRISPNKRTITQNQALSIEVIVTLYLVFLYDNMFIYTVNDNYLRCVAAMWQSKYADCVARSLDCIKHSLLWLVRYVH